MRHVVVGAILVGLVGGCQDTPVPSAAQAARTPIPDDGLQCVPVNFFCGCAWECALVRAEPGGVFVRLDSEGSQQFRRDPCSSQPCFRECAGDTCQPALVMPGESCEETCPPSDAPFSCRRVTGQVQGGRPCEPVEA